MVGFYPLGIRIRIWETSIEYMYTYCIHQILNIDLNDLFSAKSWARAGSRRQEPWPFTGPRRSHPPLKARPAQQKTAPNHGPLALSNRNLDMCSVNDRRQIVEDRCKSCCLLPIIFPSDQQFSLIQFQTCNILQRQTYYLHLYSLSFALNCVRRTSFVTYSLKRLGIRIAQTPSLRRPKLRRPPPAPNPAVFATQER